MSLKLNTPVNDGVNKMNKTVYILNWTGGLKKKKNLVFNEWVYQYAANSDYVCLMPHNRILRNNIESN